MNKLVKGSIAGAAGIALLLAGGATLASWNSASTVDAGSITAGQLQINAQQGTGTWMDGTTAITDIENFLIVPGDTLSYTAKFDVIATGDNLEATVALGAGSIAPAVATDAEDLALASLLESTTAFQVGSTTTDTVVAKAGTQVVEVTVTIEFPSGDSVGDNKAQAGSVDLSNFTVTLTQKV